MCVCRWVCGRVLIERASIFHYSAHPGRSVLPFLISSLSFLLLPPSLLREDCPFDPCTRQCGVARGGGGVRGFCRELRRACSLQVEMRCITDRISCMLENNNNHRKEVIANRERRSSAHRRLSEQLSFVVAAVIVRLLYMLALLMGSFCEQRC